MLFSTLRMGPDMDTPIGRIKRNDVKLRRAIRRLVKAEVAYSWHGAGRPEDFADLVNELKLAKKNLYKIINQVVM